ncbi:MAG: hypothetical protein R3B13_22005 [Polyangiaceae bacterium]
MSERELEERMAELERRFHERLGSTEERTGGHGERAEDKWIVPYEEPGLFIRERRASGCVKCAEGPEAEPNLTPRVQNGYPKAIPECDGQLKRAISMKVNWKNAGQLTGSDYHEEADHMTAMASVETWDELVALARQLAGLITNPMQLASSGLTSIDNQYREFKHKFLALKDGKNDIAKLRGKVTWGFAVDTVQSVVLIHGERWDSYVDDQGNYDIKVDVLLDGMEVDGLQLPNAQTRAALASTPASGTPGAGPLTKGRGERGDRATKSVSVQPGPHDVAISFDLRAGKGGMSDEAKRRLAQAWETFESAFTAVTTWLQAAFQSVFGGSGGSGGAGSGSGGAGSGSGGAGSGSGAPALPPVPYQQVANAALSALSALTTIIDELLEDHVGYVRVFESRLEIACGEAAQAAFTE